MQNLLFGVYLLISDFQAEYLKINKNEQKGSLILQYSFTQKNSLIVQNSTRSTL